MWHVGRRCSGWVAWCPECRTREAVQVRRLGPNADDEQLQPSRVAQCYPGILLDQPLTGLAPEPCSVLVVAPAVLLHERSPAGRPGAVRAGDRPSDRVSRDLVSLADLAVELRVWPQQT
jgi:hypothetical protein